MLKVALEEQLRHDPWLVDVYCEEENEATKREITTTVAVGIGVLSALFFFMIVGTIYDMATRGEEDNLKRSKMGKFVLCFSVVRNTEKIFDCSPLKPGTVIPTLDGMRVLSNFWVVTGHSFGIIAINIDNVGGAEYIINNWSIMGIISGTYSVDTFFFLAGLLACYLGMKYISKKKGPNKSCNYVTSDIPLMYFQRYLRLTTPYALVLLFSMGLIKYLGTGPYWYRTAMRLHNVCVNRWWQNLLYINVFWDLKCMPWTWYLGDDMMFYLTAPFLVLLLFKSRIAGLTTMFLLFLGSVLTVALLAVNYDQQPLTELWTPIIFDPIISRLIMRTEGVDVTKPTPISVEGIKNDNYIYPWTRYHVYIIGMATGYLLFAAKLKIKMSKAVVSIGWILCAICGILLIYGYYFHNPKFSALEPQSLTAFYLCMQRPAWAFCLAWIVVACSSGYGGLITRFLNWSAFRPLGRLSYSAYLVHYFILWWYVAIQEGQLHFSTANLIYYFLGSLVLSYMVAYLVAIFIEWPTIGIINLLFPRAKSKTREQQNQEVVMNMIESRDGDLTPDVTLETAGSYPKQQVIYPSDVTTKPTEDSGSRTPPPSYDTTQTKSDLKSAINPAYEKDNTFL